LRQVGNSEYRFYNISTALQVSHDPAEASLHRITFSLLSKPHLLLLQTIQRARHVHGLTMSDGQADGAGAGKRGLKEKLFHPFNHRASEKIEELQSKLASTKLEKPMIKVVHAKHKAGKFTNIFNTNHRHDEEHEQKTDDKRSRIAESHRFNSFAPERDNNFVKWYVDGRDYFWVRSGSS
jgi:hypothetical protein